MTIQRSKEAVRFHSFSVGVLRKFPQKFIMVLLLCVSLKVDSNRNFFVYERKLVCCVRVPEQTMTDRPR